MAKINWVFQNEIGTNLNRYRAINVNTQEETIFDLYRNGTIQIVGTPLSAENLNSLITAINEINDDYLSKNGGKLNGELILAQGDGYGIQLGKNGRINATTAEGTTNATVCGINGSQFLSGHSSFEYVMRGKGTNPKYNNKNVALFEDIPFDKIENIENQNGIKHLGVVSGDLTTFLNSQKTSGLYSFYHGTYNTPYLLFVYNADLVYQSILSKSNSTIGLNIWNRYYASFSNKWYDDYKGTLSYYGKVKREFLTTSTEIDPTLSKNEGIYLIETTSTTYGPATELYEADFEDDSDELTFQLISSTSSNSARVNYPSVENPYFTAKKNYTITKIKKIMTYY